MISLWMFVASVLFAVSGIATAAPAFQAAGAAVSGVGAVSPAWPAHTAGDVALLFVESAGGEAATLSTPAGFVEVTGSPQASAAGTSGTRLTVFWARATSAAMPTPTVADTGDHVYARILTYRGVINSGDPWDAGGGGVRSLLTAAVTGLTTTSANTRVVQAITRDNDSAAAEFSGYANGNLSGIAERSDGGTVSGNGGGVAIWDGVKAAAGATGDTTVVMTTAVDNAYATVALKPQPGPRFQAAGTAVGGTAAVSPAWPAHQTGDVALLIVESAGGEAATLSTPAGFAAVPNSPQATGAGTAGTRLTVFWARATSGAMAAPTVANPGNHVYAQIVTFRGVVASGNPWNVTGGGIKGTASNSVTVTGVTTTVADTLVVQIATRGNDLAAAAFSNQANANLSGIAERVDAGTAAGNGGGFALWEGYMASAGATGDTTADITVSTVNAFLTIALAPDTPAAPDFQAAGAAVSGTGAVSPAWPAHAIGDVALLFVESAGGEAATLTTPAGFVALPNTPQSTATGTAGTRLTVFWARATSTAMTAPTVGDPGDHVYARIVTYRGAINNGDPWDATSGGIRALSTTVSLSGVTTTTPDTLVVQAISRDNDSAAAAFSAQTNAALDAIIERSDIGTTQGNGGGIAIWDGGMAVAGATGNTTVTGPPVDNAYLTLALKPQNLGPRFQAAGAGVGGTGAVSPAWPAHVAGDVAMLFVESPGGQPVTLSTPAGFVEVPNSPQFTGAGTAGTRLTVFWARATSGAMTAPTVADPGDHLYAQIVTYRGVSSFGDPWDVTSGGVKGTASTAVVVTGVTTTVANTLIVQVATRDNDAAAAAFSNQTNANLTSIAERLDAGTIQGNGGGFALWDGYKATAGATGDTNAVVSLSTVNAFMTIALRLTPPLDHYELSMATASVTCLATTVTVTACADTSSPCTNNYAAASGTTATLATDNGSLGSTTVTFNASGVATTTLNYPGATDGTNAVVTLSGELFAATNPRKCCPDGTSCAVGDSCTTNFKTTAFIFADAADGAVATVPVQVAGTPSAKYWLRAVKTNTTTKACEAALTGATSVGFAYQCNNPAACYTTSAPACGSGSGYFCVTPYSSDGATAQTPALAAANADGSVSSYADVTMNFDANGNAPFTFRYADVGRLTLWAKKAAGGALLSTLTGSSNAFVVKPYGFKLTGLACTPIDHPSTAAGAFCTAGGTFTGTVSAVTYDSGQPNNLGAATPSFGHEATAQTVALSPNALIMPTTAAGGTLGSFATSTVGSFTGTPNVATATMVWSNVGTITIKPTVDYLGAGDLSSGGVSDSVAFAGNVGRFYPYTFGLVAGSAVTPACLGGGFTYMDQPVLGIDFTLEARAKGGAVTSNYFFDAVGGYDNDPATLGNQVASVNLVAENNNDATDRIGRFSGITMPTWSGGQYALTDASVTFARDTSPDGPYDLLAVGVGLSDMDAVIAGMNMRATTTGACTTATSPATDCNAIQVGGATKVRYGRLRLINAYGSELLPVRVPVRAEYYSSTGWSLNSLDVCTTVPAGTVAIGNVLPPASSLAPMATLPVTLAGGGAHIVLTQGATKYLGSVDVAVNLAGAGPTGFDLSCVPWGASQPATSSAALPWLQFAWCSGKTDPSARAKFGSPKAPYIYLRERY